MTRPLSPVTVLLSRRTLLAGAALWQRAARAQSGRVYRIMIIAPSAPIAELTETGDAHFRALFQELRRRGYVNGQNLAVDRRSAEGRSERLPELAREAAALRPDLVYTTSGRVLLQLKAEAPQVPGVGLTGDPVRFGIAASLARPGGNVTGVSVDGGLGIEGKRLELLREATLGASRVAYLSPREGWASVFGLTLKDAAERAGMALIGPPLEPPIGEAEYRRVFAAMARQQPDAILVSDYNENMTHRRLIAELAAQHRLPAMYPFQEFIEAGGMMAYVANVDELIRRLGDSIDRILLKGEKPGEIPFYQASKFDLIIDLKAAKVIGLTLPQSLVLRAEEVIE